MGRRKSSEEGRFKLRNCPSFPAAHRKFLIFQGVVPFVSEVVFLSAHILC